MKSLFGLFVAGLCLVAVVIAQDAKQEAKQDTKSDAKYPVRKILVLTKSSGFEHSVVKVKDGQPCWVEKVLSELGPKHNFEFTFTKNGSMFTPENIAKYDAFLFYTTGDLTQPSKDGGDAMTPEGKAALLAAINKGKGFIGSHCATDTFHSRGKEIDPYIGMVGGEFLGHGKQQKSQSDCCDADFPGMTDVKTGFELLEEWYSLKNLATDMHVLLRQETKGMDGWMYQRTPFPATWARMQGSGRVFYTSMGHREDVWTNPIFQKILIGGINWACGNVKADVTPNLDKAAAGANTIPTAQPKPAEQKKK